MTSAPDRDMPSNVLSLSAGQRLRLLRTLHTRLLNFPQQDDMLATLLARWPELFVGNPIFQRPSQAGSSTVTADLPADAPGSGDVPNYEALVAALAASQHEVAELQQGLVSSRVIGTAIGVLMASEHVTQEQAFELLRNASMRSNRKLRDIAAEVVLTGTLPEPSLKATPHAQTDDATHQGGAS